MEPLQTAMKRIQVKHADCADYLRELPDSSVDVIYFDPMFHEPVETSDGIAPPARWQKRVLTKSASRKPSGRRKMRSA